MLCLYSAFGQLLLENLDTLLYHFDRFVGHASEGPLDGDEFWCRSQVTGPVGCLYLA